MKKKLFAALLALVLVLSLVPANSFAATPMDTLEFQRAATLAPTALPQDPVHTNGKYNVTLQVTEGASHGEAALLDATSGDQGDMIYFLARPEPGYLVEIGGQHSGKQEPQFLYGGMDLYALVLTDGHVNLNVRFVKAPGSDHTVSVTQTGRGMVELEQSQAKPEESIVIALAAEEGYVYESCTAVASDGTAVEVFEVYEEEGAHILEFFMPNQDVEVFVNFADTTAQEIVAVVNGMELPFLLENYHEFVTMTTDKHLFYEDDVLNITITPVSGYVLEEVRFENDKGHTQVSEGQWQVTGGAENLYVYVTVTPVWNPVTLVMDSKLGGTAALDVTGARTGETVTLTCSLEEGYRVAQILGADVRYRGNDIYTFTMPDHPVELHVLFLRENNPFVDVTEERFYYDSVMWAMENEITDGMDATHFGPVESCNRAQVVTFLWRAAGCPKPTTTESPFTDVSMGKWYTDAVLWAVETGITDGMGDGTFGVGLPCNRAQVVTFLHRAEGKPAPNTTEHPFTDLPEQSWYTDAVLWAVEKSITTGATTTTFDPNGQCMRAVVVTFLYRVAQLPAPEDPEGTTIAGPLIIDDNKTLSDVTIDGDVYIKAAGVVTFERVTVTGGIYCHGQLTVSDCIARDIYAYAYGSMLKCSAYDGVHGKITGGIRCNNMYIANDALDYAFATWGK